MRASLAWDPSPDTDRGPELTLRQAVGAEATGGMDALLRPETARVMETTNDDGPDRRRLEARLGYGDRPVRRELDGGAGGRVRSHGS